MGENCQAAEDWREFILELVTHKSQSVVKRLVLSPARV